MKTCMTPTTELADGEQKLERNSETERETKANSEYQKYIKGSVKEPNISIYFFPPITQW